MRILFNHGLSASELYTNTPKKVIDIKWRNLRDEYGWCKNYADTVAEPFKYCLSLILNTIIDEKVRFKIPYQEAYIDFEITTGDKFLQQRQNGRFQDIDFVESDFTGYFINYYFKTKAYQKAIPIYIGGSLKKKFLDGINSGVKYYTTKDLIVDDFIDKIQNKFPLYTKAEVKRIVIHGFRRMHSAIKFGCAISIVSRRYDVVAYIGKLTLTPEKNIKEYSVRRDRKFRKIYQWNKTAHDGYYYIGLNEPTLIKWSVINKKARTIWHFTNIIPRKIVEELYYKDNNIHIFRYPKNDFKGYSFWADKLKVRKLEYLGKSISRKFYASDKNVKEIIEEYEKK